VSQRIFSEHEYMITDVKVSKQENLVYTIDGGYTLRVWNLNNFSCIKLLDVSGENDKEEEPSGFPLITLIEPNNQVVVTGYDDFTFKQWDLVTGHCAKIFNGHKNYVRTIDIDHQKHHIVSASAETIWCLWNYQTGACEKIFQYEYKPGFFAIKFTKDGEKALIGSGQKGDIIIWDIDQGQTKSVLEGHNDIVHSMALTPEGDRMLSVSRDSNAILWDLKQEEIITLLTSNKNSSRAYAYSVVISPDGRLGCVGDEFGQLEVWNMQTISLLRILQGHGDALYSMAFFPDSQHLIACSRETSLVHDLSDLDRKPAIWALCAPISSEKEDLIEKTVQKNLEHARVASEVNDFKELKRVIKTLREISGNEWLPEVYEIWQEAGIRAGRRLGLIGFRKIKEIKNIHQGVMKISWDGNRALITNKSKLIFYDFLQESKIYELDNNDKAQIDVIDLAGNTAVSGRENGLIQVWNIESGECLEVLDDSLSRPCWISFFHAGHSIFIAREDGCVYLWDWNSDQKTTVLLNCLEKGMVFGGFDSVNLQAALCMDGKKIFIMKLGEGIIADHADRGLYDEQLYSVKNLMFFPKGDRLIYNNGTNAQYRIGVWDLTNHYISEYFVEMGISKAISPDGVFVAVSRYFWDPEGLLRDEGVVQLIQLKDSNELLHISSMLANESDFQSSDESDQELEYIKKIDTLEASNSKYEPIDFSLDGRYLFVGKNNDLQIWELLWDYEFPEQKEWNEGAQPYIQAFLNQHCSDSTMLDQTITSTWEEADFQDLLFELGCRGFGWLSEEGVRRKLKELAAKRG